MTSRDFTIGGLVLKGRTVFAPLAGISDRPMRLMARREGCALVCSEMISANGLVHDSPKTRAMLRSCPEERPLSVQLFGADPVVMADAAAWVEAAGADILDINFGCSVRKILKTGAGAALMRMPEKARELLQAVRRAVRIPLTVKMRTGWDASGRDALTIAAIARDSGVDALTVHPRTAPQGFSGRADWRIIALVRNAVDIPVIGNGDVQSAADVPRMLRMTGCAAVMIGRSAIGNPWIFSQAAALLAGRAPDPVRVETRFKGVKRYLRSCVALYGETNACRMLRSRLGWFVKGLPNSSRFRASIRHLSSEAQARAVIDAYEKAVARHLDGAPTAADWGIAFIS